MTNQNQAKAIYAFRNNGTKAPISVMFEMEVPSASSSIHNKMISRGLGNSLKSRLTLLMSYTEEQFNQDFNSFGMGAEDVKSKYKNELGEIAALKLDFTTEQLFGEAIGLRRIDTTDLDLVSNEEGEIKPNWSVKQVNGQELTHEGALIYSTVEFCEVGQESIRLKQDQDLRSNTIGENIPQAAKVAAPF